MEYIELGPVPAGEACAQVGTDNYLANSLRECEVYRNDAHFGPHVAERRAEILAEIGEADAALAEIERLLVEPSWLTVHILRLDPRWDPLRDDPRFQGLLVKYAVPQPVR